MGGGKRGSARPPHSSAGDSQADQSGPQSITIRPSDVQSDGECSRRGVITALDGVTPIKVRASPSFVVVVVVVVVSYKRNRFFTILAISLGIDPLLNRHHVIGSSLRTRQLLCSQCRN